MKILIALLMLSLCCVAHAQSGRGSMHGYVDFEEISYNDLPASKVRARVELRGVTKYNRNVISKTETDEHG